MNQEPVHSLLARQLKRCFGTPFPVLVPGPWREFVEAVNAAYRGFDTDRQMLERSLELSSQELLQAGAEMRAVFQSIPDLIVRLDAAGNILGAKTRAGGKRRPPRAAEAPELAQANDPARHVNADLLALVARVVATKEPGAVEYRIEGEHETRHYEARLAPVLENQVVAFIREITARRRAEALRAAQTGVLELIVSGAPLRAAMERLALLAEAEVKGMRCSILLVDECAQRLRGFVAPSLPAPFVAASDGIPIGEGCGACGTAAARRSLVVADDIRKGEFGSSFAAFAEQFGMRACWSAPIMSSQATVLGTLAMYFREPRVPAPGELEVITIASHLAGIAIQRRQAEQELQRSVALLQSTFDSTADGILVVDEAGRIVSCNQQFLALWRISREELAPGSPVAAPGPLSSQVKDAPAFLQRMREGDSDPEPENFDLIEFKDGRVFERYSCPHRVDGRLCGRVWNFRDISQRRQLERKFLQSQKMEAFGQLAGGVAHDFNNLLTVIIGNLSLVALDDLPPAQAKSALDDCFRAAQRAANLTGQLLTFSRLQPIEARDIDLNEVVANLTKMLHRLIGEHIVLKRATVAGGAYVRADPGMMEQVLMNLALNSRDAMTGGGTLSIATAALHLDAGSVGRHARGRPGQFVRLTVGDTGAGIPKEHLPHIFEPFYTTKEAGKGTGLGLATVFGIVEQHSGWIEVESKPGVGTTMHVFLPATAPSKLLPAPSFVSQAIRGNETILVTEDEAPVRALMCNVLRKHGYFVHAAGNAAEALDLWRRHRGSIDLLITDMVMPGGVTGRELARRILAEQPELRVIYCSGYTDEMLGVDPLSRRAPNFMEKPFDTPTLLERVRRSLDAPPAPPLPAVVAVANVNSR